MSINIQEFEATGRVWLRNAIPSEDLVLLDGICGNSEPSKRVSVSAGICSTVGQNSKVGCCLNAILPNAFPTRVVSFSKSEQNNWSVPWHQDRVIAVSGKHSASGYSQWSRKGGIWHCELPVEILKKMLFVRLHLDDDVPENGAMQIALGSHMSGRVESANAESEAAAHEIETCVAQRGDILVLKMLTLHRSCPSRSGATRRVLRVDYANEGLHTPLTWAN